MKGVVFSELLDMVDEVFGPDVTERVLASCDLPSGGAYTSVGTYDHAEILQIVAALSRETGAEAGALVHAFGKHLFHRLVAAHPEVVEGHSDPISFARTIQAHIHVEVRKLYPEAELPDIAVTGEGHGEIELRYQSSRPFAELAHGLLEGSIEYFGREVKVERLEGGDSHHATFRLASAEASSANVIVAQAV
jgi:hypothetical protein